MKNFFSSLLLLITFAGLVYYLHPKIVPETMNLIRQPCSTPLTYKIGNIDKKYGISRDEFTTDLSTAGDIWSKATGKQLFEYQTDGKITVNLIYDERQALETKVADIQTNLQDKKQEITPSRTKYDSMVADYKQKVADLNSEINGWNSKGGAPLDVYQQLVKKQQDLRAEAGQITNLAKQLNQSVQDYNSQVSQLKQTAENLNETIQNKPEEGIFDPNLNEIDIYLNVSNKELIHTLAHELGHSIGVEHNSNPDSIMYPYTTPKITASKDDITAMDNICNNTLVDRIKEKLKTVKFRFAIPGMSSN